MVDGRSGFRCRAPLVVAAIMLARATGGSLGRTDTTQIQDFKQ